MLPGFMNSMFMGGGRVPLAVYGPGTIGGSPSTRVTSTTVTLPTDRPVGSLAILVFATENSGTITTPSGWTQKSYSLQGSGVRMGVFTRVIDGSESGTFSVTTGSARNGWACGLIVGAGGAAEAGTAAGGSSTTPDPPSVTPSWGDQTMFLAIANSGLSTTGSFTALPSGYTDWLRNETSNASSHPHVAVAYRIAVAATENPSAFTASANNLWNAQTLAVQEAS